jgi:hypothetical protein
MNLHADVCIQSGTTVDRQYLLDRVRDSALGRDTHVVYIYSLADDVVGYPNKEGQVVYIGEAGRPTEPTGKRFAQHISTEPNIGGDSGTIYALSRYYWTSKAINLRIFLVSNQQERKRIEQDLLCAHVKEYGSLPICQGTTGENYKTSMLTALNVPPDLLALFQS